MQGMHSAAYELLHRPDFILVRPAQTLHPEMETPNTQPISQFFLSQSNARYNSPAANDLPHLCNSLLVLGNLSQTLPPTAQQTISIPLMQFMAKKQALSASDKAMKRKADEIHPCKDKAPFDIARELLSHFADPPPFHPAEEDSTLARSCEQSELAINNVIIFLQDQAGAAAEMLSLGSLLASEEVKLVAQMKFMNDMVIVLQHLMPSVAVWVAVE